jgi:hypothetical protein
MWIFQQGGGEIIKEFRRHHSPINKIKKDSF